MSSVTRFGLLVAAVFALASFAFGAPQSSDISAVPRVAKELLKDPTANAVLEVSRAAREDAEDEEFEIDDSEKDVDEVNNTDRYWYGYYQNRQCSINIMFKLINGNWGGFPGRISACDVASGFKFMVTGASWGSVTIYSSFGHGTSWRSPHKFRVRPHSSGISPGTYYIGAYPRCGRQVWKKLIVEPCPQASEEPGYGYGYGY